MNEPLKKYARVGLVHFMAFPQTMKGEGPILETIRTLAIDDYFDAIEITTIKDPVVRKCAAALMATSKLAVAYGGQPRLLTNGLNINDLNEDARQLALTNLKEGIDEAYEVGARSFAFLAGKYEESTKAESYKALVASTKELCAYAKSKGDMKLALEVFDYDVDKKSLIGPAPLAKRYASEVCREYDNFGLMVDLSHIPLIHETIRESLAPVREFIVHAHIGNCVLKDPSMPAYGDVHPRFGFPNGENDVPEVMEYLEVLFALDFFDKPERPFLSFEVKPFGDESPEAVIANAKRTLNEAWARLELKKKRSPKTLIEATQA
jgi:sugar phosphate isomerase/epimerase